jgi:hypothetical protein
MAEGDFLLKLDKLIVRLLLWIIRGCYTILCSFAITYVWQSPFEWQRWAGLGLGFIGAFIIGLQIEIIFNPCFSRRSVQLKDTR